MTKISAYDDDETLSDNDRLIGTDNPSGRTKEFPLSSLTAYLSTKGIGGASAYDIAVSNGFVGTEEEWLESLKVPADDALLLHKAGTETITGQKIFDTSASGGNPAWKVVNDGDDRVTVSEDLIAMTDVLEYCSLSPAEIKSGNSTSYISTTPTETVWSNAAFTKSNKLNYEKVGTGTSTFKFPEKAAGTYTLVTADEVSVSSSGTWEPTDGTIDYNRSYWIKTGNVVNMTVGGTVIGSMVTSTLLTLPNSFAIDGVINGRLIGTGVSSKSPSYGGLSGEVVVRENTTTTQVSLTVNNPTVDTYHFSVTFSFLAS